MSTDFRFQQRFCRNGIDEAYAKAYDKVADVDEAYDKAYDEDLLPRRFEVEDFASVCPRNTLLLLRRPFVSRTDGSLVVWFLVLWFCNARYGTHRKPSKI
jgi:hypothetical protein